MRFGEAGAQIELAFAFDEPSAASAAERVVRGIDGVTTVRREDDLKAPWHVIVEDRERDAQVRNAMIRASLEHDYPLVSVRSVQPSLEDIYRRAVARTAPAHGAV